MNELENTVKRGPGRPPKYQPVSDLPAENLPQPQAGVLSADEMPRTRATRKPFGSLEQKGTYPERPGFHRHWFNDVPGRIQRAQEAGYEHVKDKDGKNVSQVCGTTEGGQPLLRYIMEIPEEWFKEDMALQQERVNQTEEAMKRGKLEEKDGDNRYVPSQGISIKHGS